MASAPIINIMRSAVSLHKAGRVEEAAQLYRIVLQIDADHPDANHNLGSIALQRGQQKPGLTHLGRAASSSEARPSHLMSYAQALKRCGHKKAASASRKAQIAAETHQNLSQASGSPAGDIPDRSASRPLQPTAGDEMERAATRYGEVIASRRLSLTTYSNLADAFREAGEPLEAVAILRRAIESNPKNPELHCQLGDMLTFCARYEDAIAAYRAAISLKPTFADAHYRLGTLLSEHDRISEGFQHLMLRAQLIYGNGTVRTEAKAYPLHKTKHDGEQRDFLAGGKAPHDAPQIDEMFHLSDGERIRGPVINPAHTQDSIIAGWRENSPQMVVLDDFLTPQALKKLQTYCAESTIWKRIYEAGYIGAIPADGFACPLLAQLAEEIPSTWPAIFSPHRFKYLGAFKYDSELSTGTNTHADFAAVNVNFYIAPDEANLDPASGGMKVWNCSIGNESQLRLLNSDERAMNDHLVRNTASATSVPHRENRAIIFKSSLVHKTDEFRFQEGYLNKRINVSLLFGEFGTHTK